MQCHASSTALKPVDTRGEPCYEALAAVLHWNIDPVLPQLRAVVTNTFSNRNSGFTYGCFTGASFF